MKHFVRTMKALSDPNRVRIIKLLQHRDKLCVCELTAALALAQPTVSKHLKVLEDAQLVQARRDGAWVNYRLDPAPDSPYAQAMLGQLQDWLDDDEGITALLQTISGINRIELCKK